MKWKVICFQACDTHDGVTLTTISAQTQKLKMISELQPG